MTQSENCFKNKAGHQKQYDVISYKQRRQSRHCGPEEMQEKITKAKRNLKLKTLKTGTWDHENGIFRVIVLPHPRGAV